VRWYTAPILTDDDLVTLSSWHPTAMEDDAEVEEVVPLRPPSGARC